MRSSIIALIGLVLLPGCGNMLFPPKTASVFEMDGPDQFTITTNTEHNAAITCMTFEAARYCATTRGLGVAIALQPVEQQWPFNTAKGAAACRGPINQYLLETAINSHC